MLKCEDCGHVGDASEFPQITEEELFENFDSFDSPGDWDTAMESVGDHQCPECGSMVVLDSDGNRPG
jgi:hypothetical protein